MLIVLNIGSLLLSFKKRCITIRQTNFPSGWPEISYFNKKVNQKIQTGYNTYSYGEGRHSWPFYSNYSKSVFRKAKEENIDYGIKINNNVSLSDKEIQLLKNIYSYPEIVNEAGNGLSPAIIANYTYDLVKNYNQFYHDFSILKEENEDLRKFRLMLSKVVVNIIKSAMDLLGIEVPERM